MKFLVAFALAVACAHADVSHVVARSGEQAAEILKSESDVNVDSFNYAYETSNGIVANAEGVVQNANSDSPAQVVRGRFSYPGPDGVNYEVTYTADENGYQPQGAHLPVAPEIPAAIARSLEYIRTHAPADEVVRTVAVPRTSPVVAPVPAQASAFASVSNFGRAKPVSKFGRF